MMTTNYYLRLNRCEKCGRYDELHIGLSACGWRFLFQYIEGKAESIEDWRNLIKQGEIFNEYGSQIEENAFWELVTEKQNGFSSTGPNTWTSDGFDIKRGEFS